MSGSDWDVVSCATADGDEESCGSVVSVESFRAAHVAASLLDLGMPAPEVAELVGLDREETTRIEHMLPVATTLEGWACHVEQRLSACPEAFLCSLTGRLMEDPGVDADGKSCERSAAETACHPNPHLKGEIRAFRAGRARAILSAAPELMNKGFPQAASRLLGSAADLCRAEVGDGGLVADLFELSLSLDSQVDGPHVKLARLLAERRLFSEVASRCGKLGLSELQSALSHEQLAQVYSAARAKHQNDGGEVARCNRMVAGRALLAKISAVEAVAKKGGSASGGIQHGVQAPSACGPETSHVSEHDSCSEDLAVREVAFPRRAETTMQKHDLLKELYEAEPAADLCAQLARSCVTSVPLDQLRSSLESLPEQVLEAAAAWAKDAHGLPAPRACAALLAAARRVGPSAAALELLRGAWLLDPGNAEARDSLAGLLLAELEAGSATDSMKAELAWAFLSARAFGKLARHYEALGPWVELPALQAADARRLAASLWGLGESGRAAGVALAAAAAFEAGGAAAEAFDCFRQVLQLDGGSEAAKDGVKRLGLMLGRELESAACLASAGCGPEAARRSAEAAQLIEAALSRKAHEAREEAGSRLDRLERKLRGREASALLDGPGPQAGGGRPTARPGGPLGGGRVRYVELGGFEREALNARYYSDRRAAVNGSATFWTAKRDLFIYMRPDRRSWAIAAAKGDAFGSALAGKHVEGYAVKGHSSLMSPAAAWEESTSQGRSLRTGCKRLVCGAVGLLSLPAQRR